MSRTYCYIQKIFISILYLVKKVLTPYDAKAGIHEHHKHKENDNVSQKRFSHDRRESGQTGLVVLEVAMLLTNAG